MPQLGSEPSAQTPLRILIADDRARTRSALRALFAAYPGYEVVGEAADGNEALERVEQLRPDLVVLDLRMPGMAGIAAITLIKSRWPTVRVIAHSLAVECREQASAAGADAFVSKGGRPTALLNALGASPTTNCTIR